MATLRDYFAALAQNGTDEQKAAFYRGEDLSRFYPEFIAANQQQMSLFPEITDPLNQLDSPVPDPLKGNMFQDAIGGLSVLALPFMVSGISGALGGASGLGTGVADIGVGGAAADAAGAGLGGAAGGVPSTLGGLADAAWGVNPAASGLGEVPSWMGDQTFWTNTAGGASSGGLGLNAPVGGFLGSILPNGTTIGDVMLGGQLLGSGLSAGASLLGANTQANADNRATDATMGMFNTLNAQGAPYRAAGYQALGQLMDPAMQSYLTHQFGPEDLQKGLAPGYEFMLDQGLRATRNAANAQTGLLSGNTLQGINNYAQQYALNQGYQPSFQNFQSQREGIYNRLASIAGLGQTANAQSVDAGQSAIPAAAQSIQNYGTALGGGFVGAGNALAGGLNNALSWYTLPSILNMGRA